MYVNNFSSVAFTLGSIDIRYYGLAYVFSFVFFYLYLEYQNRRTGILQQATVDDLFLYVFLGVVLGGRLGYVLFYDLGYYVANLMQIFYVWQGGMSFHGGLLGVILAVFIFVRKYQISLWRLFDMLIIPVAFGLILGRLANFINSELVGYPSSVSWCVVFPTVDEVCRHPSQLYAVGKDLLILLLAIGVPRFVRLKVGQLASLFLITYGIFRIINGFFRMPDIQLIFIKDLTGFSLGQILSMLMIIFGFWLFFYLNNRNDHKR